MVAAGGAVVLGGRSTLDLPWQMQAWRFYGTPDGTAAANIRLNRGAVGEVRFVMGWIAEQIARVGWHVDVDAKRLDNERAKEEMAKVSNEQMTITIATNLIVAGEFNYMCLSPSVIEGILGAMWDTTVGPTLPGEDDKKWISVSVIDTFRQQFFEAAKDGLNIRGIWPHPARPISPDPPMAAVLDVLCEIEQLGDLAFSQNRSRIANMGILTVANDLALMNSLPNGTGTMLGDVEMVINAPLLDPRRTSAAPILFAAPMEYFTGALSNGARGLQWTKPDLEEYSHSLESRMRFAIQRLAWGFPVAPEILLGMTATNRAVAFQIEESTYRAYIEPICDLVGRIYARALKLIWPDADAKIEVLPDATDLLARRHSIADAKDLYDRGIVGAPYVRRVAGVDDEDKATQEDLDRIILLRKGLNPGEGRELDPSEVSGNEPVRASAAYSLGALGYALEGALEMCHAQFLARVGAATRTRLQRTTATPALELDPEIVPNRRLPSFLGPDRLAELGVDIEVCARPVTEWLADWWSTSAQGYSVGPFPSPAEQSTAALASGFQEWCRQSATVWPAKLPQELISLVLRPLEEADNQPNAETLTAVGGGG